MSTIAERNRLAYFVAHAPVEPQPWFQPKMSTKEPTRRWCGVVKAGKPAPTFDSESEAVAYYGPYNTYVNNHAEISDWYLEHAKQRLLQWPLAWALEMVKQLDDWRRE
jgi:hypothetical protein